MYSINDYGGMILDRGRTEAHAQAIRFRELSQRYSI
jgi:hypothetical protein